MEYSWAFQSTLPMKGATGVGKAVDRWQAFQSTLPVWGGTLRCRVAASGFPISIHPPRVGRDKRHGYIAEQGREFQSTLPVWGGTSVALGKVLPVLFQSTLPVWGGTGHTVRSLEAHIISIHPPRVGRDLASRNATASSSRFQSTLPVWGGTAKMHKNSFLFHALSTNSLAFFVTTSCFLGENQKAGGKFVKISVRRSQGNPGCSPLAPVYTIRVPPGL